MSILSGSRPYLINRPLCSVAHKLSALEQGITMRTSQGIHGGKAIDPARQRHSAFRARGRYFLLRSNGLSGLAVMERTNREMAAGANYGGSVWESNRKAIQ